MYCPSCGNTVAEGLKYCNRCGASLAAGPDAPAGALTGPAWAISLAMTLITLGGLSMLFVVGLTLVKRGSDISPSAGIMMLSVLALIALVDWMLVRQLARVIDLHRVGGWPLAPAQPADAARGRAELAEPQPARLDAPREPFISVTEQTTRTLEQVPRERDTRPQP